MRNPRIRWMCVCSFDVLTKCGVAYNKRTSSQPLRSLLPTLGRKNDISVIPFLETKKKHRGGVPGGTYMA